MRARCVARKRACVMAQMNASAQLLMALFSLLACCSDATSFTVFDISFGAKIGRNEEVFCKEPSATFGSVPCACVLVSPLYYKPSVKKLPYLPYACVLVYALCVYISKL